MNLVRAWKQVAARHSFRCGFWKTKNNWRDTWRMRMKWANMDFLGIAVMVLILMKNKDWSYFPDILLTVMILLQFKSMVLRDAKIMQLPVSLVGHWGFYTHEGLTITAKSKLQLWNLCCSATNLILFTFYPKSLQFWLKNPASVNRDQKSVLNISRRRL